MAPDDEGGRTPPINLVLVHGGKKADFAFLRAYHDPDDLQRFIPMSGNIIDQPIIASDADAEPIRESEPQLKASAHDGERSGPRQAVSGL